MEVTENVRLLERVGLVVVNNLATCQLACLQFANHDTSKVCPLIWLDIFAEGSSEGALKVNVEVDAKNASKTHQLERMPSHMTVCKSLDVLTGNDPATQGASHLIVSSKVDAKAEVLTSRAKKCSLQRAVSSVVFWVTLIDGVARLAESTNVHCKSEDTCQNVGADVIIKRCLIEFFAVEAIMEHLSHSENIDTRFSEDDLTSDHELFVLGRFTSAAGGKIA